MLDLLLPPAQFIATDLETSLFSAEDFVIFYCITTTDTQKEVVCRLEMTAHMTVGEE